MATLRELREAAVLSQGDLAERARVARTTINELESDDYRRRPRPSTIRKLAKALKVKPQEIDFGGTPWRETPAVRDARRGAAGPITGG